MATVTLPCKCGRSFSVDAALAGTTITCPTCGTVLTIPSTETPRQVARDFLASTVAATPASSTKAGKRKLPAWFVFGAVGWIAVVVLIAVPMLVRAYYRHRGDTIQTELNALPAQQQVEQARLEKQVRDRFMQLTVTGPGSLQPGAPNAYMLETRTLADESAAARLTIAVKDKSGKVVARETNVASSGRHVFTVPPQASLRPDDELTLEVSAEREAADGQALTLSEKLTLERLGYVTHVTTDKPLYQPGEVVSFRSLTLDRFRLVPVEEDLQLSFTIAGPDGQALARFDGSAQLQDPKGGGQLLQGPDGKAIRGIGLGEFAISPTAPGGEYTLTVSELRGRFAPEKRTFLVNRYQAPRLHKELEFTRRSYGPGDEVLAACKAKRIEGGKPLAAQPVVATVIVDGKRLAADGSRKDDATIQLNTDADGGVAVWFKLPKEVEFGEASLSVQFTDGGNVESIVRPIPIVVRRLRVDFYPEGGDLIAGLPNRVYFQARTPLGKPADLKGRILDSSGKTVVEIQTLSDEKNPAANQGMGTFTVTPVAGQKYELQIDIPSGIALRYALPQAKPDGVVLRVDSGVTNDASPVKATVSNAGDRRKLLVAAFCRGRLVASEMLDLNAGETKTAALLPPSGVAGVLRITVFEDHSGANASHLVPIAERLAFRQPARHLNIALATDKPQFTPGEKVRLAISSTDETRKPAPGIALVWVVDRAALSLADDKTMRAMPTHFLLAGEVRKPAELENADFLLSEHPLAPVAVDLLLGTQGWRRFAEQDIARFKEKHGIDAERLIAASGQIPIRVTNRRDVEAKAKPELAEAQRKAAAVHAARIGELRTAVDAAAASERWWDETAESSMIVGAVVLVLVVIVAGLAWLMTLVQRTAVNEAGVLAVVAVLLIMGVFGIIGFFGLLVLFRVGGPKSEARFESVASDVATREGGIEVSKMKTNRQFAPTAGAPGGAGPSPAAPKGAALLEANRPGMPGMPAMGGGPGRPADLPLPPKADSRPPAEADMAATTGTDAAYLTGAKKPPPGQSARRRFAGAQNEQARLTAWARNRKMNATSELSFRDLERSQRMLTDPDSAPPFIVREYAHENVPNRETRSDFTETVYWHPVLVLTGGESSVSFDLSDALTSFQVQAYVHTTDGRLGSGTATFTSRLPFSIEAKLPPEITTTDEIHLPVAVANDTNMRRDVRLQVQTRGLSCLDGTAEAAFSVDAEKRARRLFKFLPTLKDGEARVQLDGRSDFFTDRVERLIRVVPEGFPVSGAQSGTVTRVLTAKLVLPEQMMPGSLKVRAEVYPSVMADITTGLEGMLREPYGCFEQTSSSSYPNLLILNYLQQTGQSRPDVARRALELLDHGYRRLTTFECPKPGGGREGFEWFGHSPPHEALTAYGLMQFHDLARVYDKVDPALVERTRKFLLARRDGNGNFLRKHDFHRFGLVEQSTFNAYIVWALCESEADADLNKEVALLAEQAKSATDAYFLALVANSLFLRNNKADGDKILEKLTAQQSREGSLSARETIVGSYGRDIQIETTALTVLAWLKSDQSVKYREPLAKAARWLTTQRGGYGGFGSTQATILTLKALAQLAKDSKKLTPGDVILAVNGDPLLRQSFAGTTQDTLALELTENDLKKLKPGANEVRIELTGGNELPAKISWQYHTLQPPSADNCPIKLSTALDKSEASEGETVRLTAVIENTTKQSQSMTLAIIGLPAGLELPEDLKQLRELSTPKTPLAGRDTPQRREVDYFEVRGRELILYWRGLDAGQRLEIPLDLVCRTPGQYRGPASRAYLYYGADAKCWTAPLTMSIVAR